MEAVNVNLARNKIKCRKCEHIDQESPELTIHE